MSKSECSTPLEQGLRMVSEILHDIPVDYEFTREERVQLGILYTFVRLRLLKEHAFVEEK